MYWRITVRTRPCHTIILGMQSICLRTWLFRLMCIMTSTSWLTTTRQRLGQWRTFNFGAMGMVPGAGRVAASTCRAACCHCFGIRLTTQKNTIVTRERVTMCPSGPTLETTGRTSSAGEMASTSMKSPSWETISCHGPWSRWRVCSVCSTVKLILRPRRRMQSTVFRVMSIIRRSRPPLHFPCPATRQATLRAGSTRTAIPSRRGNGLDLTGVARLTGEIQKGPGLSGP